jgi:hypothetical protein
VDIEKFSVLELLKLHSLIGERLRAHGVIRSSNNPVGDLAEYLFCETFRWELSKSSNAHVDAIAKDGSRYQIKGRRITRYNKARQLGAIRDFAGSHFDYLAAVLFDENYDVYRATIIPFAVVKQRAKFIEHTNSHKLILHNNIWDISGVDDVTEQLRIAAKKLFGTRYSEISA